VKYILPMSAAMETQIHYRQGRKEDSHRIAELDYIASGGAIEFLFHDLVPGISLAWYSFVVLVFSLPQFSRGYRRVQKWTEGVAGIIFIAFGAKLILDSD
jgi:hypothetical protein